MRTFDVEITDTFGGEANYSWVTRCTVHAKTFTGAVRQMSLKAGVSWRHHADFGDRVQYLSKSGATTMFIIEEIA